MDRINKMQKGRRLAYLKKCIVAQQLMMKYEDNTSVRYRIFEDHIQPVLMCSYQQYNNMLNEPNPQRQIDELTNQ